ncbi:MAG: nicotinamide riboside transporter PnuC [Cardiobacteriaceae bacterium]|nr:nicotinamide riboside transporter PnuC [Cardiobacteriaceae bacterium]
MNILHKITHEWREPWIILWFISGVIALYAGVAIEIDQPFASAYSTLFLEENRFVLIKLGVAMIGLLCVVALAFRKNLSGNGLGIAANIGEIFVQGKSGATGLMLSPVFYLSTHLYGLYYWGKNRDGSGDMIPRGANPAVWLITFAFIVAGLFAFPWLNDKLAQYRFIDSNTSAALTLFGTEISWYSINVTAFVLGVTAQTTMILRYAYAWWLWILVNFVWLTVNLVNANYVFAAQTIVYQINAVVGLYEWWESSRKTENPFK